MTRLQKNGKAKTDMSGLDVHGRKEGRDYSGRRKRSAARDGKRRHMGFILMAAVKVAD